MMRCRNGYDINLALCSQQLRWEHLHCYPLIDSASYQQSADADVGVDKLSAR